MFIALNDFDEAFLRSHQAEQARELRDDQERLPTATAGVRRVSRLRAIYSEALTLALVNYALGEDAATMRGLLRLSVEARQQFFADPTPHYGKTPLELLESVSIALILREWGRGGGADAPGALHGGRLQRW